MENAHNIFDLTFEEKFEIEFDGKENQENKIALLENNFSF